MRSFVLLGVVFKDSGGRKQKHKFKKVKSVSISMVPTSP